MELRKYWVDVRAEASGLTTDEPSLLMGWCPQSTQTNPQYWHLGCMAYETIRETRAWREELKKNPFQRIYLGRNVQGAKVQTAFRLFHSTICHRKGWKGRDTVPLSQIKRSRNTVNVSNCLLRMCNVLKRMQ